MIGLGTTMCEVSKWEPEEGEWCVFWNGDIENVTTFVLEKYIGGATYENIEPFEFINSIEDL